MGFDNIAAGFEYQKLELEKERDSFGQESLQAQKDFHTLRHEPETVKCRQEIVSSEEESEVQGRLNRDFKNYEQF